VGRAEFGDIEIASTVNLGAVDVQYAVPALPRCPEIAAVARDPADRCQPGAAALEGGDSQDKRINEDGLPSPRP